MNVIYYVQEFYNSFKGEKGYIGLTEKNRLIPYFYIGNHKRPIIIAQYAIHAREYVTSYLAIEEIKYLQKKNINGSVYILPMLNIDGVEICLLKDESYKANANKVDLNVNFDAKWGMGEQNIKIPSNANYIGKKPFSENETRSLRDFTLKIMPDATISYHSKGEEIYWYFNQSGENIKRDFDLAKVIEKETGYKLKLTIDSTGGYKDWCIDKLKIPSFTIEVGNDRLAHPIDKKYLSDIKEKNLTTIYRLLKELI